MLPEQEKGKYSIICELICFIENEIEKIKSTKISGTNTPRQITAGGKLLAYYKVLNKLKSKKEIINKLYPKPLNANK